MSTQLLCYIAKIAALSSLRGALPYEYYRSQLKSAACQLKSAAFWQTAYRISRVMAFHDNYYVCSFATYIKWHFSIGTMICRTCGNRSTFGPKQPRAHLSSSMREMKKPKSARESSPHSLALNQFAIFSCTPRRVIWNYSVSKILACTVLSAMHK